MRQVSLEENSDRVPPAFTLRRGWGSSLERALVFVELLRQVGTPDQLRGCLVYCPEKPSGLPRLWACGVVVDNGDDIYLFDPRLGLPVPAAGGGASPPWPPPARTLPCWAS